MKQEKAERLGQMGEEVVVFPKFRPREIEKEGSHLQAQDDKNDAKRFVHERRSVRQRTRKLASGLLKRSDAVGDIAIIDIGRIHLREALQRRFNVTRGFLRNP